MEYVRANFDLCIGVAAHPEVHPRSVSRESDRQHLAEKLRLADFAMTQFFFDIDHYQRMIDGAINSRIKTTTKKVAAVLANRAVNLGFTRVGGAMPIKTAAA